MSKGKQKKDRPELHRPFSHLPGLIEKAGLHLHQGSVPPDPDAEAKHVDGSEEDLFREAMQGVTRATWHSELNDLDQSPPQSEMDPKSEDRRLLEDALNGIPAPSIDSHPEYIEGWIGVAGRRYLTKLRNGMYSIQDQIDLHGLSRDEARLAVEAFVIEKSRYRACCVKIIHGRGINSWQDRAVLKEHLQRWLSTRRMSRYVVAYASAPFSDGGVGAVYVLLRRGFHGIHQTTPG